jgi:hypothetical protein
VSCELGNCLGQESSNFAARARLRQPAPDDIDAIAQLADTPRRT